MVHALGTRTLFGNIFKLGIIGACIKARIIGDCFDKTCL